MTDYCLVCSGVIEFYDAGPMDSWWAHEIHPPDGQEHDAVPSVYRDQIGLADD